MTVKFGDRTRCLSCMKPIVAQMDRERLVWVHEGSQPRHTGVPEAYTHEDIEKCKLFIGTFFGSRTNVKDWVERVRSFSEKLEIPFNYLVTIMELHREWDANIVKQMLDSGGSRMFDTFEADYQIIFNQKMLFSKESFIKSLQTPAMFEGLVEYFYRVTDKLTEAQRNAIKKDTLKYFLEQKHHIQSCPFADKMFVIAYCNVYFSVTDALEKNYDAMVPLYLEFISAVGK